MDGRETDDDDTLERHTDTNKLTGHTARLAATHPEWTYTSLRATFPLPPPPAEPQQVKKERKKENRQPKGGMGGRYTATTQGFQGGDSVVLAVTYPWAPASSYLSSQSVADSRCNPHATPRSSYSRRSPSRRFFLCRSGLRSPLPRSASPLLPVGPLLSRLFLPLGAVPLSSLRIVAPQVYPAPLSPERLF